MNKNELIAAMAEKTGLSKKDAEKALVATWIQLQISSQRRKRFRSLVSVHSKLEKEQQERVSTPSQRNRSTSTLPWFPLSRLATHSRLLLNNYFFECSGPAAISRAFFKKRKRSRENHGRCNASG